MPTTLITGANRGIGLELARQFSARGDDVIAVCRSTSDALDGLGVRVESGVDVTDAESLQRLASSIDGPIDVLVNNAGILSVERLGELDFDGIRRQFEVNAMGPLRVTEALNDRLSAGAKVAIITSRMGSIADNTSGSMYGYRMSKAAVNAAGKSLALDLADRGIAVALLHPGYVQTDMTRGRGDVDADHAAAGLIARLDALTPANSGSFWHANGDILPW